MPEITEIKPESSASSFLRAARAGNLEKVLEFIKGIAGQGAIDINISNANGLNALHLASKEGHAQVVDELVKRGANVNAATKKGNTALHIASLAGQSKIVELLVNNGADVNAQSQNGFTPLYMAAQENHDGVVKYLVDHGANQTITTEDGFTPLAVALQQGHNKVVSVLLENDSRSGKVRLPALHVAAKKDDCKAADLLLQTESNPDVTSKSGFTPLHIAAHYGNEAIAQILINHGSDVNFKARHDITPLHVASRWGKINMVTILLNNGAVIDAKTRDGLTPLHCAARSGHADVVDLLLSRGADISAKTKNELTPLHMAAQGDHMDCANILLQNHAPVDDVTVDYLTSLHICAHYGNVATAKLLLDHKAEVDARALNGFTPLHIACKKNRIKIIELLLKRGASIGCTTESGLTPLHVASFMGHMNIVIYLLKHGAETDAPTVRGETPLHLAARANQTDIMRIILRNGAKVDARARENQTPLHVAARLGNTDTVMLLLQHGADVGAKTTDDYTPLHLAAKEGHAEALAALLDHTPASQLPILLTSLSTKGFSPLHLAAKCGSVEVTKLLLERGTPVDVLGKNDVTPLHVASHYDHPAVANLLLEKGASPAAKANNGYTPLHIAAKKNQMDVAPLLLDHGAEPNAPSRSGFTPVHLAAQGGFEDTTSLLLDFKGDPNASSNNGLTPLHLAAQNDHVPAASILLAHGANVNATTTGGYTPLHTACHFGRLNMVRLLLDHGANVGAKTSCGYTALHQAAQQGHSAVVSLLLQNKASPESLTNQGQTALSIAQQLGYVSVIETLKVVTETIVTTTTTTTVEEKYKVLAPETMQETLMSDSEDDEADLEKSFKTEYLPSYLSSRFDGTLKDLPGDETLLGDHSYKYLTSEQMKSLGDDSVRMLDQDPSSRLSIMERSQGKSDYSPDYDKYQEDLISPTQLIKREEARGKEAFVDHPGVVKVDNVPAQKPPVHLGFLVSFMVDARGGAMRGCRHSGVRVIIPPRKAPGPLRVTCRFVKKEKMTNPPPLMEGEGLACRVLELGPAGTKFLGPVIIEIPHFASLRGNEREITILRSDNGETWREHVLEASETAVQEVLNESFDGEDALDDLHTTRITRILTNDFPLYFAIVSRIHQETHTIGPEGGIISSTIVPMVQAMFPEGALTKRIRIGLQAHPISPDMVSKMLGNRVAVSPVVTIEPRRRKFHKPITLTIPLPQASTKGMINQYNNSNEAPTLRLLCSITGGTTPAQWEDITGSTPLTFVNNYVSFTTTVSARFWLMDCRQVNEATKFATEVFREASHVPYMARMLVYAKRRDANEALMRAFTVTDDKMEKALEEQEHFTEVAQSRDVEVLDNKLQYVEMVGNLVTVTKTDHGHLVEATKAEMFPSSTDGIAARDASTPAASEVLTMAQPADHPLPSTPMPGLATKFRPFQENRLAFRVRIKDPHQEPIGRLLFLREARRSTGSGGEPSPPICTLNIVLPNEIVPDSMDIATAEQNGSAWSKSFLHDLGIGRDIILAPDLMVDQLARHLREDWVRLAQQLHFPDHEIEDIQREFPQNVNHQAKAMLVAWKHKGQHEPERQSHEAMERALRNINREDVLQHCPWSITTTASSKIGSSINGILPPASTPSDRVLSYKDAPAFTDHTPDDSIDHYGFDEYREEGHHYAQDDKKRAPHKGDEHKSPHDHSSPSSPDSQPPKEESPVTPVTVKSKIAPQPAAEKSHPERLAMLQKLVADSDAAESAPKTAEQKGSEDMDKPLVTETPIVSQDKKSQGPVPTQEIIIEPEEPKTPRASPEPKKGEAPFTSLHSPHDVQLLSEEIQSRLQIQPESEDEKLKTSTTDHEDHPGAVLKSSHFHAATLSDTSEDQQHLESQHEREGESVLKRLKIMKSTKSRTIIKDGKEETETFEETLYDDGRGYPVPFEDLDPELKEKVSEFLKGDSSDQKAK